LRVPLSSQPASWPRHPLLPLLVVAFSPVLLAIAASAEQPLAERGAALGWKEVARSDEPDDPESGYVVYERVLDGSSYRALRLDVSFAASPEEVAAAVLLRLRDPRYLGDDETRRELRRSADELVTYSVLDLPLVSDRDFTLRIRHSRDALRGTARITWEAADDLAPPPPRGIVRMHSEGFWEFRAGDDGLARATSETHADLGGFIPGWLARRGMRDRALRDLATIREILRARRSELPPLE
jgi:hypothetical protein